MNGLSEILVSLVAIAIAISVHEFGHAYSAHLLGDDTAKTYGRMSLDPLKHIDPMGLLAMLIFHIGWAKPVPVNPNNFKNYKIGNIIVSLAGAFGNLIAAIVFAVIFSKADIIAINPIEPNTIRIIASTITAYNVAFAAFNLLPIPPLDGWGVISMFVPYKWNEYVYKYEGMSSIILLLAIFTGAYSIIVSPIRSVLYNIVYLFM